MWQWHCVCVCLYIYIYIYIFLYEKMVAVNRNVPCTPLSVTLHTVCASFHCRHHFAVHPSYIAWQYFQYRRRSCSDGHMAPMIGILWYWEGSWCLTVDQSLLLIWFWLLYLREISIRFGYRKIVKREIRVQTDLMKPDIRSAVCLLLNTVETTRLFPLKHI